MSHSKSHSDSVTFFFVVNFLSLVRGVIRKFAEKCYKIVLLLSIAMEIHKLKLLLFAS